MDMVVDVVEGEKRKRRRRQSETATSRPERRFSPFPVLLRRELETSRGLGMESRVEDLRFIPEASEPRIRRMGRREKRAAERRKGLSSTLLALPSLLPGRVTSDASARNH